MSEMSPEPVDPFLNQDLMPMAKSAHELFTSFMAAGFTESQAVRIVTGVVTSILMNAPAAE